MSEEHINELIGAPEPVEAEAAKAEVPEQSEQVEQPEQVEQQEAKPEPQQRTVPVAALAEERVKRQRIQEELDKVKSGYERILERLNQPQQPPQQEGGISFEDDPIGYLRAENEQLKRHMMAMNERSEAPVRAQQQLQELQARISREESEYSQEVPEYNQAVEFVRNRRISELRAMGLTDIEINQAIATDVIQLHNYANQRGTSLPHLVFNYAKNLGFAPQAQQQEKPKPKAPGSLGGASAGTADTGMPTIEAISEMTDEEFDAFWSKYNKKGGKL